MFYCTRRPRTLDDDLEALTSKEATDHMDEIKECFQAHVFKLGTNY